MSRMMTRVTPPINTTCSIKQPEFKNLLKKRRLVKVMFGNGMGDMFGGGDFEKQLAEMKEKIDITKIEDGVLVKFKDPELLQNPQMQMMLNADNLSSIGQMAGSAMGGLSMDIEQLDDGFKIKTDDPDALFDLFSKLFDVEFMKEMISNLMEKLMGGMGDLLGGLGSAFGDEDDQEEDDQEEDNQEGEE
jgi:hypothetical protein